MSLLNMRPSSDSTAATICTAIRERRLLSFDYKGLRRVVAPYCYGIATSGAESLRAIQVGGSSSQGGFRFGKLWTAKEMKAVEVTEQTFVPDDPNYNPDDSAMKQIICRIE
jgi:hypothetical protein